MTNPNAGTQPEPNAEKPLGQVLQDRAEAIFAQNHNRNFEEELDYPWVVRLSYFFDEEKVGITIKEKVGEHDRVARERYFLQGGRLRPAGPDLPPQALDPKQVPDLFDTIGKALGIVEARLVDERQREADAKRRRMGRIGRSNV